MEAYMRLDPLSGAPLYNFSAAWPERERDYSCPVLCCCHFASELKDDVFE